MLNLCFCLGALALFTWGFFLVKKGRPFARVGGDAYAKRRRRRMLGWMMWTTAGVLLLLAALNLTSGGIQTGSSVAQSGVSPQSQRVPLVKSSPQIIPNLLEAPRLVADSARPAAPPAALDLSMQNQPSTFSPTMESPLPAPATPAGGVDEDGVPRSEFDSPALASDAGRAPPPVRPAGAITPLPPARQKELDTQMAAATLIIKKDPKSVAGFVLLGNVYAYEHKWDEARTNYEQALALGPGNSSAHFNLSDIDFMQGRYDSARAGFAALERDPDFGDLAKYNVFLCDLFGGHEEVAAKELAVFNNTGSEASYYFANVAWSFYHRKTDDAQNWLQSATQIFSADKVNLYAKPLIDLGYINQAAT